MNPTKKGAISGALEGRTDTAPSDLKKNVICKFFYGCSLHHKYNRKVCKR